MAKTELIEWVVRVQVTEAQQKALRQLAIERDEELRGMFTWALRTSPITKKAMVA